MNEYILYYFILLFNIIFSILSQTSDLILSMNSTILTGFSPDLLDSTGLADLVLLTSDSCLDLGWTLSSMHNSILSSSSALSLVSHSVISTFVPTSYYVTKFTLFIVLLSYRIIIVIEDDT